MFPTLSRRQAAMGVNRLQRDKITAGADSHRPPDGALVLILSKLADALPTRLLYRLAVRVCRPQDTSSSPALSDRTVARHRAGAKPTSHTATALLRQIKGPVFAAGPSLDLCNGIFTVWTQVLLPGPSDVAGCSPGRKLTFFG